MDRAAQSKGAYLLRLYTIVHPVIHFVQGLCAILICIVTEKPGMMTLVWSTMDLVNTLGFFAILYCCL